MNTDTSTEIYQSQIFWTTMINIVMLKNQTPEFTIGTIGIFKIDVVGQSYYPLFQESLNSGWKYITETIDSAYGELENKSTNLQDAVDLALAHEFDYSI